MKMISPEINIGRTCIEKNEPAARFCSDLGKQYHNDSNSLLNSGPEGWEVSYPSINITQDEGGKMAYPDRSGETVQMELLKLRF